VLFPSHFHDSSSNPKIEKYQHAMVLKKEKIERIK